MWTGTISTLGYLDIGGDLIIKRCVIHSENVIIVNSLHQVTNQQNKNEKGASAWRKQKCNKGSSSHLSVHGRKVWKVRSSKLKLVK